MISSLPLVVDLSGIVPIRGNDLYNVGDGPITFVTQPQFVYSHHWRDGDAVMWDNRCTLHRATTFDKTKYKRKLHRTTIAGKTPDSAFATVPGA
jgi:Taurine catabolism dioxygenase TauD, TfdA family